MKYGVASQNYTIFMQKTYGYDKVNNMLEHQKRPVKVYKADYLDMLDDLKEKIKVEKKRLGVA